MHDTLDISQNKKLLWLMALACGLTAGANYFSQPLIHSIQQSFQVSAAQAQLTVTLAQLSYALGLLLIVPLGDIANKRKFIPGLMCLAGIGLCLCACAVNLPMLWLGTMMTGLFSVAAQVLIPFATMAVKPEKIGEVVGFLMSGLLVGILLSTSLSGLLSNLVHWKLIYILSAILIFILAYQLQRELPYVMRQQMSYLEIFKSMAVLMVEERRLNFRAYAGAGAFASMSVIYSTIAMYLSAAPFHLADSLIGMVSLVGVFGALSARYVGKYADRGYGNLFTGLGCILLLSSWLMFYYSSHSIWLYILGFATTNLGLAFVHSCNQNIIFRIRPTAKSRLNSIYMTLYFSGAATGSALGTYAWNHGGWVYTCWVGLGLAVFCSSFALIDFVCYGKRVQTSQQT
ncbi:MFS transporter [Acinetobacter sp. ANC 3791]|uniref:MFS transporter n=1 Tax=Acinetobacter sp. ANC 3791 TaxID=2529836 RepID=UPI00103CFBEB|nr:MFS transporter [Acinetobacter sp. ANC 3791]TCB83890.1 MFS transporter [Acinetobacter sp. ANC 3791]